MPPKQAPIAEELLDLQRRVAEWRSSHPRRSPLPEQFWTEAAGLAHSLPILSRPPHAVCGTIARGVWDRLLRGGCGVQGNGAVDWSQLLRAWRQSER